MLQFSSSCKTKQYPITWDKICSNSSKSDGQYPGRLYFLNSRKDTLKHLDFLSNVWILVEDNQRVGVSFDKVYLPSTTTTDPEGVLQVKELQEMKFFVIAGCDTTLTPFTIEDLEESPTIGNDE